MKLTIAAGGAASVAFMWLVACATNEDASAVDAKDASQVPALDAGADGDGAEVDASDGGLPCTPERLCPSGTLFDTSAPGGGLDLRVRIHSIRGRSASDVWAVGAAGTAAHFDGTAWSRTETGAAESLSAIWLRASGELAVASFSSMYSKGIDFMLPDGGAATTSSWTRVSALMVSPDVFPGMLTSAWAPPEAEWLWGTNLNSDTTTYSSIPDDSLPHYNGMWRARVFAVSGVDAHALEVSAVFAPGTCQYTGCMRMLGIHGSSADDLWAVGTRGALFHITGAQGETPTPTAFDSQTLATLEGVWVGSPTDAWAVGGQGTIRHYTGGAFSWDVVDGVPTTEDLHAVWGTSPSDVWAVGDGATVLHYDGASWSRLEVVGLELRRPDLFTVWSPAPGHVWIGGDGVILSLGGQP